MIGRTLGRYKVVRQLGAGGMGQVFLADDLQESQRVAVKILPQELAFDPQRLKRFLRESRLASSIVHENVARIIEVGEVDGIRFIAMEYLEGQSLDIILQHGPLPPADVIDIGLQIAAGLGEAHSKGIVHRDVKPANIMIIDGGKAKILDFGLAKVHDRKSDQFTSSRTDIGTAVGTVNYMSPEQVMGLSLDYRSDIFSLGVVLYEALTGKPPFTTKNLFGTVENIVRSQPSSIASLRPEVPAELEQVILKCMEKEAKNRFQTCVEVAQSLSASRAFLLSQPVSEMPEEVPVATERKKNRSARFYLETGITFIVLILLCVYLLKSCS